METLTSKVNRRRKMKTITLLPLLFLVISTFAGENLVVNGSFEDGLNAWDSPAWKSNTLTPEIDTTTIQGPGNASLRFVGKDDFECCFIQKINSPPPGGKLVLSGWIRTEGFRRGWSAYITVECLSENGKKRYFSIVTPWALSDIEWTLFRREFESPQDTKEIRIMLRSKPGHSRTHNTGTVWFDNISLTSGENVHE
jgi:hypothetical protein